MTGEQSTVRDSSSLRTGQENESPRLSERNGIGSLNLSDVRRSTSSNPNSNLPDLTIEGTDTTVSGTRFSQVAAEMFRQIDRDGNGHLSGTELSGAMNNRAYTGQRAQVVAALQEHQGAIRGLNSEFTLSQGITRADLSRFGEIASAPLAFSNGSLVREVESTMGDVRRSSQRSAQEMQLFAGTNPIRPDAIRNGNEGSGTFESTLSALAASNPDAIRSMIRENSDGTFTVTFPGDRRNPITVSRPTEAELGLYGASNRGGIWPDVMAKAYGEYAQEHSKMGHMTTPQDSIPQADLSQERIMHLLTGDNIRRAGIFDNLGADLTRAFSEDRMVVARATRSLYDVFSPNTPAGLQREHTYAVVGWNPRGADGGTVILADPSTQGSNNIRLSLRTFRSNFDRIDFEAASRQQSAPPQAARAPRFPERGPEVVTRQQARPGS